jgi:hypothetical protein
VLGQHLTLEAFLVDELLERGRVCGATEKINILPWSVRRWRAWRKNVISAR